MSYNIAVVLIVVSFYHAELTFFFLSLCFSFSFWCVVLFVGVFAECSEGGRCEAQGACGGSYPAEQTVFQQQRHEGADARHQGR